MLNLRISSYNLRGNKILTLPVSITTASRLHSFPYHAAKQRKLLRDSMLTSVFTNLKKQLTSLDSKLEVLIEKGSAAVSCDASRAKTVCRTVEHMNFFLKVNNIEL